MILYAEGDVDAHSDWEGYKRLQYEVRDGLTLDIIILVVQGDEYMRGILEVLNWCVDWEDLVPNKEHKF